MTIDSEVYISLIVSGLASLIMITSNLRIYRNPAVVDEGKEQFLKEHFGDTDEKRQKRLESLRRTARLWLIFSLIPTMVFIMLCIGVVRNFFR